MERRYPSAAHRQIAYDCPDSMKMAEASAVFLHSNRVQTGEAQWRRR